MLLSHIMMDYLVQHIILIYDKRFQNYYNTLVMKKVLLITLYSLLAQFVQAQTFVCTDINYYGSDLTSREMQKNKAKYLGSKATLTFYDNSLKYTTTENGKSQSTVFDKLTDSRYKYWEFNRKGNIEVVINLNKWVEYIRSFTMEVYKGSSLKGKAIYKRD